MSVGLGSLRLPNAAGVFSSCTSRASRCPGRAAFPDYLAPHPDVGIARFVDIGGGGWIYADG